jgi:hypothetical protein
LLLFLPNIWAVRPFKNIRPIIPFNIDGRLASRPRSYHPVCT